jgi:methionyl-tRNA formyltransferase
MLLKHEVDIGVDETAPDLAARLAEAGAPLMADTLRGLERGDITPWPQDNSRATLAPLLKKEDGHINWSSRAPVIYNRIRAFQPWPGAFTTFRGKQCHIWGKPASIAHSEAPGAVLTLDGGIFIACGEETSLQLEFAQPEGRKRVSAREFSSGAHLISTDRFGS